MKEKLILSGLMGIALIMGTRSLLVAQTPSQNITGYFVNVNGQSTGPYDSYGLRQLISQGQLTKNSLVWKEGLVHWVIAGTVEELAPLFAAATPPPLGSSSPPPVSSPPQQTNVSTQEEYKDFHAGHRWGTWGLNWLIPGLGSFVVMQDWVGGGLMLGLKISGVLLMGWGIGAGISGGSAEAMIGLVFTGLGLELAGDIWNIVRAVTYHRPRPKAASLIDLEAWNVAIVPGKEGIEAVSLSYTMHY